MMCNLLKVKLKIRSFTSFNLSRGYLYPSRVRARFIIERETPFISI